MYFSLFKALCSISNWPWVIYPMGKYAFVLKGTFICSAILAAAVKVLCGFCSYCRVYLYFCHVPYYMVSLCSNAILLSGCMHKLITLH